MLTTWSSPSKRTSGRPTRTGAGHLTALVTPGAQRATGPIPHDLLQTAAVSDVGALRATPTVIDRARDLPAHGALAAARQLVHRPPARSPRLSSAGTCRPQSEIPGASTSRATVLSGASRWSCRSMGQRAHRGRGDAGAQSSP